MGLLRVPAEGNADERPGEPPSLFDQPRATPAERGMPLRRRLTGGVVRNAVLGQQTAAEAVVLLLGASVVSQGAGLLRNVLFARHLRPDEYGLFGVAFSVLNIALPVVLLGAPALLGRYLSYFRERDQRIELLFRAGKIPLLVGLAVTCLTIAWPKPLAVITFGAGDFALETRLAVLSFPLIVTYSLVRYAFQGLHAFRASGATDVTYQAGFLIVGLIAILIHPSAASALSANLVAYLVTVALCVAALYELVWTDRSHRTAAPASDHESASSELLTFQSWFVVGQIAFGFTNMGLFDRWYLTRIDSAAAAGHYTAAVNIGATLAMGAVVISRVLFTKSSRLVAIGRGEVLSKHLGVLSAVLVASYCLVASILLQSKASVIQVLYGPSYAGIEKFLSISLAAYGLYGLLYILNAYVLAQGSAFRSFLAFAGGAVANIVVDLWLVPSLGAQGAAWASVVGFSTTVLLLVLLGRWTAGVSLATALIAFLPIGLVALDHYPLWMFLVLQLAVVSYVAVRHGNVIREALSQ